jgi:hypothetical protein
MIVRITKLALSLAILLVGGCYVTMAKPATMVVTKAPPAAVVEVRTTPAPNYVWIEGYWSWSSGSWVWVSGHSEPQRANYVWVVPHYEQRQQQQYYVSGGWVATGYVSKSTPQKATPTKSYNYGKSSNNGYQTSQKCPKGYTWSNNACRQHSKKYK